MTRRAPTRVVAVLALVLAGCGTDPAKLYEEAEAARDMGLHDAALERFLKLEESHAAAFPDLQEKIGDVYAAKGDAASALAAWGRAAEAHPESARLWEKRGSFLIHAGQRDEGKAALARSLALNPEVYSAHLNLGVSELQDRHLPEALTHLGRAAELAPENPTVLKTLGVALLSAGQTEPGAMALYAAWTRDRTAFGASKLFRLLVNTEHFAEAAEVGEVATSEDSSPETMIDYADALIRSGDGARGSRIYQALERMELPPQVAARVRRVMAASRQLAVELEGEAGAATGQPGVPPPTPPGAPPSP